MPRLTLSEVFGRNLRSAREAAGLSQRELAEKSGIKQPVFPLMEAGKVDVRLSTVERLAEALGIMPTSLIERPKR